MISGNHTGIYHCVVSHLKLTPLGRSFLFWESSQIPAHRDSTTIKIDFNNALYEVCPIICKLACNTTRETKLQWFFIDYYRRAIICKKNVHGTVLYWFSLFQCWFLQLQFCMTLLYSYSLSICMFYMQTWLWKYNIIHQQYVIFYQWNSWGC